MNARTSLRNCWISGETAFEFCREQSHEVIIVDCTLACAQVLSTYVGDEEEEGSLNIDSTRSLYVCGEALVVAEEHDAERLGQQIKWVGADNAFAGNPTAILDEEDSDEHAWAADADVWLQQIRRTGSIVEHPFNIDINEFADEASDVDFRLSEMEKSATVLAGASNQR